MHNKIFTHQNHALSIKTRCCFFHFAAKFALCTKCYCSILGFESFLDCFLFFHVKKGCTNSQNLKNFIICVVFLSLSVTKVSVSVQDDRDRLCARGWSRRRLAQSGCADKTDQVVELSLDGNGANWSRVSLSISAFLIVQLYQCGNIPAANHPQTNAQDAD